MKKSILIAVAVAVLATLWVVSGMIGQKERGVGASIPAPASSTSMDAGGDKPPRRVQVIDSVAEPYVAMIGVTGKTAASRIVELKAEVEGQIVELLADKGDVVKTGQVIARIDRRDRAARVSEASELVNQRSIEYNAAQSLAKEGFYSKTRLAQAAADLEAARAQLKLARINLAKSDITAPFDAVIGDRMVEMGDYATVGMALFRLLDLDPLKLTGSVSERVVMNLETGTLVEGTLLDGQTVSGSLSFVSPLADPATRTFLVEATLPNEDGRLVEGLTVNIRIPTNDRPAHSISPAILSLNDAGQIGVKIVDDANRVAFVPVTILSDAPDHSWVSGLPDRARIIIVGQDFVLNGDIVDPVIASTPAEARP